MAASPSHSHAMDLEAETPRQAACVVDSLASTVDRHDGLTMGSPTNDHSSLDLRKAALLRSHMRRTEVSRAAACACARRWQQLLSLCSHMQACIWRLFPTCHDHAESAIQATLCCRAK